MKKIIIAAAVILAAATVWFYIRHPLETRIQIDNHIFIVELAVTEAEKEKGLGYRDSLPSDHGMLFPYDHPERYSFWMKGMRFPIDILWIKDNTIADITKNIPVDTSLPLKIYSPKVPVNKVLEVNAGTCDTLNIQIGDVVRIRI